MGITYKEYVWLIKPEDVNEIFDGGVWVAERGFETELSLEPF